MKNFLLFFLPIHFILLFQDIYAQKSERVYLSGKGFDDAVEWDFYCTEGRQSGEWTTIAVPSCWEQQGFGTYNYGHDPDEGRGKEQGLYRYSFYGADDWKGKVVNIVFEGSMTDTEVKINGQSAGPVHQGAFYRFSYDISKLIKYGNSNQLEINVRKHSSNESVNDAERRADYWIFGGIFRPVFLEIKPSENFSHIAIDARDDGSLTAQVSINNPKSTQAVKLQLFDLNGNAKSQPLFFEVKDKLKPVILEADFNNIVTWNPENPVLYNIIFSLMNGDQIIHEMKERIGFRTVEIRGRDGIYINGVKVLLKGVCRHSFWPETGRTLNKELSIKDVLLMKDMNMNAVRMSHYPPDKHFLDVCDSLGLFVLDELAGWQASYDTEVGKKLIKEMVMRDVNHPSIIIWDNGNEGGWNTALDDEFVKYDPQQRIVIHPWEKFRKTDTNHYIDYFYGTHEGFNGTHVYFPTEFLHGLFDGGHGAGLDDYWNLILSRPRAAGGFLWVFSDESVYRSDLDGLLDSDGNHAPDGILGPHREKEGSYYTIKEIWAPVQFEDKLITGNFDGVLKIKNHFHYTNLNQCNFFYELVNFPKPEGDKTGYESFDYGQIKSPAIGPGESGFIKINLPENWEKSDALYIEAVDPFGREIFTWDWAISLPEQYLGKQDLKTSSDEPVIGIERENAIEMTAQEIKVIIHKETGLIQSVFKGDTLISLSGGPSLAEGKNVYEGFDFYQEGNRYVYEAAFSGNQKKIRWTMYGNGLLQLNYQYYPNNHQPYFGINFNYPEEKVNGITWLGEGPYRVWKNRLKGTRLNIWHKKYNNTITGESYNYPEFKGYHAGMYWARIENNEKNFMVYTATENLYLRLFTPGMPEADARHAIAEFPDGDLSFLQGISPIGTKFKSPDALGPQSQMNMYRRHRTDGDLEIELLIDFR